MSYLLADRAWAAHKYSGGCQKRFGDVLEGVGVEINCSRSKGCHFCQVFGSLQMRWAMSNLVPYMYAFVWEKVKTMDFSETIEVYNIKIGRCSQLNESFMRTKGHVIY